MKSKGIAALFLALSLLLNGCGWLDGSYVSVTPHSEQRQDGQTELISASNFQDLAAALEEMVSAGTESGVINVADYPQNAVESGMAVAVRNTMGIFPLGAYAVEDIQYELGTNSGIPAIAVTITYRHSRTEIQMIRHVPNMEEAETVVTEALAGYDTGVVMLVEDYHSVDFTQLVEDYAEGHPESVMETPQVTAAIHGSSETRVVELTFAYQNSRDSLRQMQSQVQPVFDSAVLYVSGDGADRQKYSQLYAFLMERFDYKIETSITPSYSLLRHGVGDSRAFAVVYAAMCRDAGLECLTVTGTHSGEPRTWNIVLDNGHYYHVDLLRCSEQGGFREFADRDMENYVWDYSAYPECPVVYIQQPEETTVSQQETEGEEEETQPPESAETEPVVEPTENFEDF